MVFRKKITLKRRPTENVHKNKHEYVLYLTRLISGQKKLKFTSKRRPTENVHNNKHKNVLYLTRLISGEKK
ncbi:hypothetical protein Hanom_Chr09g00831741 [Helianthus anomalus]